ncbi:TetR/AcrR family transcriptional regulator [Streptomyces sp. NPDC059740]|uniref:TetR/AcrR family transcriptional regulator n=1 Tax=Streptomyces sp. NPDC059740 TaxID=3346926 RepID=UPI0036544A96
MTPARGDHEARRRDVSRAVWRVLAERGFEGLTLRAVAAEMGATTGLLTHYFPAKRDLLDHALRLLDAHSRDRPRRQGAAEGLPSLRAALLDMLPLDRRSTADNRVWVASWGVALADPRLTADHAARYRASSERLAGHLAAARERGELSRSGPVEEIAAETQAFVLGLVVQALLAPEEFPPERQTALLDDWLTRLSGS